MSWASATQTLRALQDSATSLAQLAPMHETLVQTAQRRRWAPVIAGSGLTADQLITVEASPAYGPLVAALRRAEHDGHPMCRVLPALVATAPLDVRDDTADDVAPARDLAAVLHHRVTAWHERAISPPGFRAEPLIGGLITPAGQLGTDVPEDQRAAIEQVQALMRSRANALIQQTLHEPPSWLRALGAPPADPRRRNRWLVTVEMIAAYRDRYRVPEHGHPLGDPDPADPNQRIARRRALAASQQARAAAAPHRRTPSTTAHPGRQLPSL